MHHFVLIVGFALLQKVSTLKCYECVELGTCSNKEKECPTSNTHCGAMRLTTYVGSTKAAEVIKKSCIEPGLCLEGSINFGVTRNEITSKCCSSDLCNADSAPEPTGSGPNGRKCYTCGNSCDETLNCQGSEDHCISAFVTLGGQKMAMKGCASKQICANTNNKEVAGKFGAELNCCQGDYCNGAGSTTASLLLLVAPLLPLTIFSF